MIHRYLLGIETDGQAFASAHTARDRERLRRQVLEDLGWKVMRVYLLDWLHDRAGELLRIQAALEERRSSPPKSGLPGANEELRPGVT